MTTYQKRLLLLLLSLPFLVLATSFLYMAGMAQLEDSPLGFWDSLAWAGETLTTTGYGHQGHWDHPLMVVFVTLAQFIGVFIVFLVFPIYLIPYLEERFEARVPRTAPAMHDHVVIFHYGPAVETLLGELSRAEVSMLVVEQDERVARSLVERKLPVIYHPRLGQSLEGASLSDAKAMIANADDETNAAAILTARQLGFEGEILVLVEEPTYRQPLRLAGATTVFTPRHMLAAALAARASLRISPRLSGVQKLGHELQVDEIRIDPQSELVGQTLAEAHVGGRTGTTVIGQWVGGHLLTHPSPDMRLEPRGILIAAGNSESLERLEKLAGGLGALRRGGGFVVAGYGEVGHKVVQVLREVGEEVRVIDRRAIDGVDLVGDALDPEIQAAADLDTAQAVILALDSDSATLFATLVLRNRAPDLPIIARVNEADNVERIHGAGADFALSISQVSGQMLAHRLLEVQSLAIDTQLRISRVATAGLEGRRPQDLQIRERTGCSVVAVERDEDVHVELGSDFVFRPGDSIYVCGSNEQIRHLERDLASA